MDSLVLARYISGVIRSVLFRWRLAPNECDIEGGKEKYHGVFKTGFSALKKGDLNEVIFIHLCSLCLWFPSR